MKSDSHSHRARRSAPLDLNAHSLVVCLGPGGVGKTTISAALAVTAAVSGRSVDVMTVDPAPRLLDALGLDPGTAEPREVLLTGLGQARRQHRDRARLRALKLDPKRTFDSIVARHAPSDAARDAILGNRIYRNLSDALAGVGDFMAMEKLLELTDNPTTNLVVLDTPPAVVALDFLDAPQRMLDLLGSRAISLLGAPGGILRSQLRVVDIAARAVLAAFDRVTGLGLLADIQTFVRSFDGLYEGFASRAERAREKLRSAETAIVVVTTAEAGRIAQATDFMRALDAAGMRPTALIVNRVMAKLPGAAELAYAKVPAALRKKLKRNLADYAALKVREQTALNALRNRMPADASLILAPELGREPRNLGDLAAIGRSLSQRANLGT